MANQSILVVEDSKPQSELIKILCEKFGFNCHCVATAEDALEALTAVKFSAVLLDIGMPKMNGFECCKIIREREQIQGRDRIPVIAITASSVDERFRYACTEAGIDDFLAKPFEAESLRKILLRHTYTSKVPNLRLLPGSLDRFGSL